MALGSVAGAAPNTNEGTKKSPGHAGALGDETSIGRTLDGPILSQSCNAQNCYLAMAAMRPDRRGLEPTAGTCHDADSPRTVAMTILPTQALAAGSVPANTERQRKPRALKPGL